MKWGKIVSSILPSDYIHISFLSGNPIRADWNTERGCRSCFLSSLAFFYFLELNCFPHLFHRLSLANSIVHVNYKLLVQKLISSLFEKVWASLSSHLLSYKMFRFLWSRRKVEHNEPVRNINFPEPSYSKLNNENKIWTINTAPEYYNRCNVLVCGAV